jgi:hypothetical protein
MHRRYTSGRGRFDQPDPWDGSYELSDPQSMNRYSYVQNDPVNFVDPTGLSENLVPDCSSGTKCEVGIVTININEPMHNASLEQFFEDAQNFGNDDDGVEVGGEGPGGVGGGGGTGTGTTPNPSQQTQGLSDCVKNLLTSFFQEGGVLFPRPMNLDTIRIHNGVPDVVKQFAVIEVGAITVANDIYASNISQFQGRTWADIQFIAHELIHVQQYAQLRSLVGMGSEAMGSVGGTVLFGATYLGGYLMGRLGGKDAKTAEGANPYEKAAEAGAIKIVKQLQAAGKKPCPE